jgi:hypothetical protein
LLINKDIIFESVQNGSDGVDIQRVPRSLYDSHRGRVFLPRWFHGRYEASQSQVCAASDCANGSYHNVLQLLLCVVAIAVGKNVLAFSMSVAGLLFINGLMHIIGCVRVKGYAPGAITGVLLYMPLSVYAYYLFISSGQLPLNGVLVTGVLGLLYQAVPISYFVLASAIRRA